jgi:6-phosphogluconolactonase (cycloisomerase 2 family)
MHRIDNNIAIFAIKNDGKLTSMGYQSTLGNHPGNFYKRIEAALLRQPLFIYDNPK